MAGMRQIDFSKQLSPGADPVSPNGQLLVAAGQQEGQAAAEAGIFAGKQLETVGGVVLAAGKGYLESGLETDMKKTITAYDARVKTDMAQTTLDLFDQGILPSSPPEVEAAKATIQKYKDALDQGVMTREQALLAIDKSVKDYSNQMPGWATDFRKQAATLTGVEHMGNYAEASLLAKAGAHEDLRKRQLDMAFALKKQQLEMFQSTYGRLPNGSDELGVWQQQLAIKNQTEVLKNKIANRDLTVQQSEPLVTNYVNTKMADGIITLNTLMQNAVSGVDPKTGKPIAAVDKYVLRENMLSQVGSFFEKLKGDVLGFNTGQLSNATRETLMNRLNTQQKELVDGLKNQDAFDSFKKIMEFKAASAQDIMNSFALAHPQFQVLMKSGMVADKEVIQLFLASRRDPKLSADFDKRFGLISNYFQEVMAGGPGATENHIRNMVGSSTDPAHLDALKTTNPGAFQTQMFNLKKQVETISQIGWGETPEVQGLQKKNFADNIKVFASQIPLNDPTAVKEWTRLMADPRLVQRVKELPTPTAASYVIIDKTNEILNHPEMGVMTDLTKFQKRLSDVRGRPQGSKNAFELTVDATDQVGVKYYPTEGTFGTFRNELSGRGLGVRNPKEPIYGDGSQIGDGGTEFKGLIKTLNQSLAVINNFSESLPESLRGKLAKDMVDKFNTGYFALPIEQRGSGMSSLDTRSGKGLGFLGELKRPDGKVSTEISVDVSIGGKDMAIPTLVPGLTKEEINTLLTTNTAREIPESIINKAVAHAKQRISEGKSPFAGPGESSINPDQGKAAIIHAEGSNVNAGLSPKGALGMFQLMEKTAKAYGLTVDKSLGIDERLDPEKAGNAAVTLLNKLHTQFGGDLSKVAAAYNAGEGNVRKAEAKAEKVGMPGMWSVFLPKPGETGPYIKRFLEKYNGE